MNVIDDYVLGPLFQKYHHKNVAIKLTLAQKSANF